MRTNIVNISKYWLDVVVQIRFSKDMVLSSKFSAVESRREGESPK